MVNQKLYASLAQTWPAKPTAAVEKDLRTMPASLLNWLLVRILNHEAPAPETKDWIKEALVEAKEARRGDLVFWRLIRWTSLAAAQELVGDFGELAAQEAIDWVVPASKKAKLPWERTELATCVIGLLNYFEGDDALSAWTHKQLQQEWQEGAQSSIFQTLYLADPASADDDLDLLAFETAHACALLIDNLPGQHAAGLVLALTRRARDKKLKIGRAMKSGIEAFENLAQLSVRGPQFSIAEQGKPGLVMSLTLQGEGRVVPLCFLFSQLTGGFTRELRSFLRDVAQGKAGRGIDRKTVIAAVKEDDATFTAVVKYDSRKLEVPEATQHGLERRFKVAVAHARTLESKLPGNPLPGQKQFRANAKLTFVDTAT